MTATLTYGLLEAGGAVGTANDRFKGGFGSWFWGSLAAAALVHFLVFALWPGLAVADGGWTADAMEVVVPPPDVEIPPEPERIRSPAMPVVSAAAIEATILPTTFETYPVDALPDPPATATGDVAAAPAFTPFEVRPELENVAEVRRALRRHYPSILRDSGVGGTANVWFFIDEQGKVVRTLIKASSGYAALDEAALKVAELMRFSPARNRDRPVPVWVAFDITFQTH